MTALYSRSLELVAAILDAVYDPAEPAEIPWVDLVNAYTTERTPAKTVDNTIRDLIAFGALHRIGQPATRDRPDTRAVRQTDLGRAWLAGELPPRPHDRTPS